MKPTNILQTNTFWQSVKGLSGRLLGVDVHVRGVAKETNSLLLLPLFSHLHKKIQGTVLNGSAFKFFQL